MDLLYKLCDAAIIGVGSIGVVKIFNSSKFVCCSEQSLIAANSGAIVLNAVVCMLYFIEHTNVIWVALQSAFFVLPSYAIIGLRKKLRLQQQQHMTDPFQQV